MNKKTVALILFLGLALLAFGTYKVVGANSIQDTQEVSKFVKKPSSPAFTYDDNEGPEVDNEDD